MKMSYYKIDKHIKKYITTELYNYEDNKKKIGKFVADKNDKSITTRSILIATEKVKNIERALEKFSGQEKEDIKKIFFKGHSQIYAEINDGISKDMYYHLKDKMIYLTAQEYGQI
jgi:hypothetical protein